MDQPVVNSETMQHVCKLKCALKVQIIVLCKLEIGYSWGRPSFNQSINHSICIRRHNSSVKITMSQRRRNSFENSAFLYVKNSTRWNA